MRTKHPEGTSISSDIVSMYTLHILNINIRNFVKQPNAKALPGVFFVSL